jgi:hypothetical protein
MENRKKYDDYGETPAACGRPSNQNSNVNTIMENGQQGGFFGGGDLMVVGSVVIVIFPIFLNPVCGRASGGGVMHAQFKGQRI